MEMSNKTVLYDVENTVGIITLNRPKRRNAITFDLNSDLLEALSIANADEKIRAIILTGSGEGFCAGADMASFGKEFTPEIGRKYIIDTYPKLMGAFLECPKPIIGAINGVAAGAGAALALACDLRVMAENAAFMFAFANIGLGPDGGASWLLGKEIGYSRAFEIAAFGKPVVADRCLEIGLTNRIAPADELLAQTKIWATELAARPTMAIGLAKLNLYKAMQVELKDSIIYEAELQVDAFKSHDFKEGVTAFIEKRKPTFLGK